MVLGKDRGMALVEALDDVEAMIIQRQANNKLVSYYSSNFKQFLR